MTKKTLNYFPEGIALGESFLNREEERQYLINRIKANKHNVLIAPRRYGKTSLVMKVATEMNLPSISIDLLAAYSEEYIRDQIIDKVSELAFRILPKANKAKEVLLNIFQKMNPEISLGVLGQKLSLNFSNKPLQDISTALLKLNDTAKHFEKSVVIFIDEFQQISQLKNYHSIEASIRHAVERSTNVSYIFSGSDRGLLEQMFGDQGRALYRLCQTISLHRIKKNHYFTHLNFLAKKQWKKPLNDDCINLILNYTECHPYYTNVLCQFLWAQPAGTRENGHLFKKAQIS